MTEENDYEYTPSWGMFPIPVKKQETPSIEFKSTSYAKMAFVSDMPWPKLTTKQMDEIA